MARSAYMALYKAVMNINEDGRWPHEWHGLEGYLWIKRDTPTICVHKDCVIVSQTQHNIQQISNVSTKKAFVTDFSTVFPHRLLQNNKYKLNQTTNSPNKGIIGSITFRWII